MLQLVLGNTDIILTPGTAESLVLGLLKLLFVVAILIYVVFAVVVVRQIHIMRSTVVTPASNFILWLGFGHLAMAILVLVYFLVIL